MAGSEIPRQEGEDSEQLGQALEQAQSAAESGDDAAVVAALHAAARVARGQGRAERAGQLARCAASWVLPGPELKDIDADDFQDETIVDRVEAISGRQKEARATSSDSYVVEVKQPLPRLVQGGGVQVLHADSTSPAIQRAAPELLRALSVLKGESADGEQGRVSVVLRLSSSGELIVCPGKKSGELSSDEVQVVLELEPELLSSR
ncbi:MAG: hypothetical protein MK135_06850 [Polyangiaceae bacterium]|nr:hypothetical protein [Polyangiaceae bacterium]